MRNRPHLTALLPIPFAHQPWTVDVVVAYLLIISTVYLVLPHLIFYFGWLQWPWALLAAASVCVALIAVAQIVLRSFLPHRASPIGPSVTEHGQENEREGDGAATFIFTRQHAVMIGAIALIWLTLAGVGGFVSQDLDWNKHNMVLNSLTRKPWPTVYEIYKVDVPLVYYLGYYLPAALVGQVGGWFWANQALFLWSLLGLIVAMLWFCVLVRRVSYSVLLVFVFFSGLDIVGKALATYGRVWNIGERNWQHIDSWNGIWQYSSHATLLNWVPHQALAGWIVMGMTLYCLISARWREFILLPMGLSAFWSPFVTLGMLPYLVLDFLVDNAPLAERIRRMISLPNLIGVVALAVTGFYFSAKVGEGSPIVIQSMLSGLSLDAYAGPTFDAIAFLLFFCLLEFGLYVIILYRSGAVQGERWRWMFDITVLTLCILPWFKLGIYNDLVMRASIPALFVLAVIVTRAVHDRGLEQRTRVALIVVLLVGAVTAGFEFRRHLVRMVTLPAPITDGATQQWDFVYYMQRQTFFFGQYAGAHDSFFFRYAAKPVLDAPAVAGSDEDALNRHDFLLYGNQVYLLRDGMTLPAEVAAGETVTVSLPLHFFGPANVVQLYEPVLRLVDGNGVVAWEMAGYMTNRPSISPYAMTHWTETLTMTVPMTATPGLYNLEVGFYGAEDGQNLVAYSVPEGEAIGEMVAITSTTVRQEE